MRNSVVVIYSLSFSEICDGCETDWAIAALWMPFWAARLAAVRRSTDWAVWSNGTASRSCLAVCAMVARAGRPGRRWFCSRRCFCQSLYGLSDRELEEALARPYRSGALRGWGWTRGVPDQHGLCRAFRSLSVGEGLLETLFRANSAGDSRPGWCSKRVPSSTPTLIEAVVRRRLRANRPFEGSRRLASPNARARPVPGLRLQGACRGGRGIRADPARLITTPANVNDAQADGTVRGDEQQGLGGRGLRRTPALLARWRPRQEARIARRPTSNPELRSSSANRLIGSPEGRTTSPPTAHELA